MEHTIVCPKCKTKQPQQKTCIKCGLIFEKYYALQEKNALEAELKRQQAIKEAEQQRQQAIEEAERKRQEAIEAERNRVICSTGDIPYHYEILCPIFAYGSSQEGIFKSLNPFDAYQQVTQLLMQEASKIGATGVIYIHYDYQMDMVDKGIFGLKDSFQVFAYGTAVRRGERK